MEVFSLRRRQLVTQKVWTIHVQALPLKLHGQKQLVRFFIHPSLPYQ